MIYTIKKDKTKFAKSTKDTWKTKTAAVITSDTNFNYSDLVFKPKTSENHDKKYTIKMSTLVGSKDKKFEGDKGYYSSTLTWDYSDWYKFNSELGKTKWLTKGQKNALLEEFKKNLDSDGVQLKENSIKNIGTYINEIKNLDITQQSYEERYLALINYLETKNPNSEFSNKQLLLLSSKSNATALNTLKLLDSNYANAWNKSALTTKYDSYTDKPKDRTQNQANKIIDLGNLNNAISNLNSILSDLKANKLDGLNNINNFYAKLDQKELTNLSKHAYNNQQVRTFVTEELKKKIPEIIAPYQTDIRKVATTNPANYADLLGKGSDTFAAIEKVIDERNKEYEYLKKFLTNIKPFVESIYFKGANTLIASQWNGRNSITEYNDLDQKVNEVMKRYEGTLTGNDKSKNVFSTYDNLGKNFKFFSTTYDSEKDLAQALIDKYNSVFGNGALVAKGIYSFNTEFLNSQQQKQIVLGTPNATDNLLDYQNGIIVAGKNYKDDKNKFNNLIFDKEKNQITDNTKASNLLLWQIAQNAYEKDAQGAKKVVNSLTNIPTNIKNEYINKIEQNAKNIKNMIITFDNPNDVNKLTLEDNELTRIVNEAKAIDKAQDDLNKKAQNYGQTGTNFDYSNKAYVTANSANIQYVIFNNKTTLNGAIPKAIEITEKIQGSELNPGKIKVKFNLTSGNKINGYTLVSKDVVTSNYIEGFAYSSKAELDRLNEIAKKMWVGYLENHNNLNPDEAKKEKISIHNVSVNKTLSDSNNIIKNPNSWNVTAKDIKVAKITHSDYENGYLPVSYTLVSTFDPSVKVTIDANSLRQNLTGDDLNRILVKNFLTEQGRIDQLANRITVDVANGIDKSKTAASEIKNVSQIAFGGLNNLTEAIKEDSITIGNYNDDNGTLDVTFKVRSNRDSLTNIVSQQDKTITISGFKHGVDLDKEKALKQIDNLIQNSKGEYPYLTSQQANSYKEAINKASSKEQVAQKLLEAYKEALKTGVNVKFANTDMAQKNEAINNINNAQSVDEAINAFNNLYSKETNDKYKKFLEQNYPYLNKAQLDNYKNLVDTTEINQRSEVIDKPAKELNSIMKELLDAFSEQYKALNNTQDVDLNTLNTTFTNDNINYRFTKNSDAKSKYLDSFSSVFTDFLNKNSGKNKTYDETRAIEDELLAQYRRLDGQIYYNLAKSSVEKLNDYLTQNQKDQLTANLSKLADNLELISYTNSLSKLKNSLASLKELANEANEIKKDELYTYSSSESKANFDKSLSKLNDYLSALEQKDFTSLNNSQAIETLINEQDLLNKEVDSTISKLDGLKQKYVDRINNFTYLSEREKQSAINEIEEASKYPNAEYDSIVEKAFSNAQVNAQSEITKLTNLSGAQKNEYAAKIQAALVSYVRGQKADKNLDDIVQAAKKVDQQKVLTLSEIDKLTNFNDAQKNSLKDQVKESDLTAQNALLDSARDLNSTMKEYKDIQSQKNSNNYKNADSNSQRDYDNKLAQRDKDIDKVNGANLTKEQVTERIANLKSAANNLNGDKRLEEYKKQAKAKITSNYSSLTEAQKNAASSAIDRALTLDEVEKADINNSSVNQSTQILKDYITSSDSIKKVSLYTAASQENKTSYDNEITAAKKLLEELNKANSNKLLDQSSLSSQNSKIATAIKNLNGDSNLTNAKNAAIDKVNNAANLNNEQKAHWISEINKLVEVDKVNAKSNEVTQSDSLMAQIIKAVNEAMPIVNLAKYLNATFANKTNFETIYNTAKNLVDKAKGAGIIDNAALTKILSDFSTAKEALDGDKLLAQDKVAAKNKIDNLPSLNNAQKTNWKTKVDEANSKADIDNNFDQAKYLDDAMQSLTNTLKRVSDELNLTYNFAYKGASLAKKNAYDEISKQVSDLINKANGTNKDLNQVKELEKELIIAKNNLDGNSNLAYKKEVLINEIKANSDLTLADKEALIAQVNSVNVPQDTTNKEEVNNFEKELKNIQSKEKLIARIRTNDNLSNAVKDLLTTQINQIANDDSNIFDQLANVNKKLQAAIRIGEKEDLNAQEKEQLMHEIASLSNKLNVKDINKAFENATKKALLYEQANKLPFEEETINSLSDNLAQISINDPNFDNLVVKQNQKIEKIKQTNQTLENTLATNKQIEKLVKKLTKLDVNDSNFDNYLNNSTDQNSEISKLLDDQELKDQYKQQLIDDFANVEIDNDNFVGNIAKANDKVNKVKELLTSITSLENAWKESDKNAKLDKNGKDEIIKAIVSSQAKLNQLADNDVDSLEKQTNYNKELISQLTNDNKHKDNVWQLVVASIAGVIVLALIILIPVLKKKHTKNKK
ncbi:hypothetical protein ACLRE7_00780 [Mycoplasmopsis meleagridis]|uniref:hypothetical protein n=1 Tax=Mycoplasmopsis meleagridis TaxID=29561 RepID=UPI003A8410E8